MMVFAMERPRWRSWPRHLRHGPSLVTPQRLFLHLKVVLFVFVVIIVLWLLLLLHQLFFFLFLNFSFTLPLCPRPCPIFLPFFLRLLFFLLPAFQLVFLHLPLLFLYFSSFSLYSLSSSFSSFYFSFFNFFILVLLLLLLICFFRTPLSPVQHSRTVNSAVTHEQQLTTRPHTSPHTPKTTLH